MDNLVELGLDFHQLEMYFHALVHFPPMGDILGLFRRTDACEQSDAKQYLHSSHLVAVSLVLFLEPLVVGPALFLLGPHLEHNRSGVRSGHFSAILRSEQ